MAKSAALILAKGGSNRLHKKNVKDFHGTPMFLVNVKKCLDLFDEVYVSSDDMEILDMARLAGAKAIWRDQDLCGETPNIPVYQHALKIMGDVDFVVAVHACSPTLEASLLSTTKRLMEMGHNEVMTVHPMRDEGGYHDQTYPLYGSIWALSKWKLENYGDPFKPRPDVLLVDPSVDIHDYTDYARALRQ